jgi:hypothetical protein
MSCCFDCGSSRSLALAVALAVALALDLGVGAGARARACFCWGTSRWGRLHDRVSGSLGGGIWMQVLYVVMVGFEAAVEMSSVG